MEVILIRHFKTAGNLRKCYIGRTDEPLADCEENLELRKKTYPQVQRIVASPMIRCVQTAEQIYGKAPDILCDMLRETDFGLFEGKNFEELKDTPEYQKWLASEGTLPFPDGEDRESFAKRCREGFRQSVERLMDMQCSRAAFVVHGGTIMAVLSGFSGEDSGNGRSFYDWQTQNGGGFRGQIDEDLWKQGIQNITEIQRL